MSTCPKCGAPLKPGARECENCRAEITALGAQAVASATAAPGGEPMEPDDPALAQLQRSLASLFKVERRLSRGGLADVYQAVELNPPRPVALKVLPPGLGAGPAAARFKHEAQLAMALNHPNIVPVYRVGLRPAGCFFALKLVEGRDLAAIIEAQGALPLPATLVVLRAATAALAYAHGRGTLHGAVDGGTILVDRDGRVMVTDFGIARAVGDDRPASAGPPRFVSPEQAAGGPAGPPSDQYCLGMVALLMLTGSAPSEAGSASSVRSLLAAREGLPGGLVHIVQTALAQDPAQRYASTADMLSAIKTIPFSDTDRQEAYAALGQLARGDAVPKVRVAAPPQPEAKPAVKPAPKAPVAAAPAEKTPPPAPAPRPAPVTEVAPAVRVPAPAPAARTAPPAPAARTAPPAPAPPPPAAEAAPAAPVTPPPAVRRTPPPTRVAPAVPVEETEAAEEITPPTPPARAVPHTRSEPALPPTEASPAIRTTGGMRRPRAPSMSMGHGVVGVSGKEGGSRTIWVIAAVVVLAALGGGGYWFFLRHPAATPVVQAPAPAQPAPAQPATPAPVQAVAESARADTTHHTPAAPAPTAKTASAKPDTSTGQLLLYAVPAIADVRVDGNSTGTNGFVDTDVTAGRRHLQISAPGYATLDTFVNVRPGRTLELGQVALTAEGASAAAPANGKLRLRTVPATAQIFVDGQAVGVGSLMDFEVAAGQRQLRITAPGYAELDTLITVDPGATVRIGQVSLKSSP